jgi:FkbM family methyltransferase
MNWLAHGGHGPFWARLPDDLGGYEFLCDLRDPLMREACVTGRYEPQETLLLRRLLAPGETFVDVGANWGYFTLAGAHLVGRHGCVLSVEADPRAYETLSANVTRNGIRATALHAAASDQAGYLTMAAYGPAGDTAGNFGVALTASPSQGASRFDVLGQTLDAMLDEAGIERVHLMKMDIEGNEHRALAGLARRMSSALVDRLVLELHPSYLLEQGSSVAEVIDCLEAHRYKAWRIDHSPRVHRLSATTDLAAEALLSPLAASPDSERWPHLLLARRGLEPLPARP